MEFTWSNRIDLDLQLYDKQLGMVDNAAKDYMGDMHLRG